MIGVSCSTYGTEYDFAGKEDYCTVTVSPHGTQNDTLLLGLLLPFWTLLSLTFRLTFPSWLSERRPFGIFFIIIFSLPQNIIQDHSSHCHVNNDYSQLFIPSSELHSIPPKVSAISPLWIWQKYLKFNIKDKNSWSNSNLVQFQHYPPRWKLHNVANCARWKTRTRFKDFFFYRCQLCIHSITKYCWLIFLNIPLIHSHSPSLLPPYTQMPSILMWPN